MTIITSKSIQTEPKLDSTYVNNLNNKSVATENEHIIENKNKKNLRTAKFYNLEVLNENEQATQITIEKKASSEIDDNELN